MSLALTVTRLTRRYPGSAGLTGGVSDANFELPTGTFFTLLGPSGCGKTTTLRCIAGLEQPQEGAIRVAKETFFDAARGIDVPMNRRQIGMVFQSYAIWPHMTVAENVGFPLQVSKGRSYKRGEIAARVKEALRVVSLDGLEDRSATRLSGGQQQRVALARAIVAQPSLLLLDEPLSNLDAALRETMRNEMRQMQKRIGVTTVYVTHDQTEALEMSDVIAVMDKGKIVQIGSPRDIYFRPANVFVASFVGSSNWLTGTTDRHVDGMTRVNLSDGRFILCKSAVPPVPGEARVAIRPETVRLHISPPPAHAGENVLDGSIVSVDFLGSSCRYIVDVGGAMFQAHGPALEVVDRGTKVKVTFAATAAMLLPA